MRLAMLVGDGQVILGPSASNEVELKYKDALRAGGNGYARIEVWSDDRGITKYAKFAVTAAGKKKK